MNLKKTIATLMMVFTILASESTISTNIPPSNPNEGIMLLDYFTENHNNNNTQ